MQDNITQYTLIIIDIQEMHHQFSAGKLYCNKTMNTSAYPSYCPNPVTHTVGLQAACLDYVDQYHYSVL